jgi:hypothetical protein
MSVAVRLATYYENISRRGTATILLSKHISCISIDNLLIGMEFLKINNEKSLCPLQFSLKHLVEKKYSIVTLDNCSLDLVNWREFLHVVTSVFKSRVFFDLLSSIFFILFAT